MLAVAITRSYGQFFSSLVKLHLYINGEDRAVEKDVSIAVTDGGNISILNVQQISGKKPATKAEKSSPKFDDQPSLVFRLKLPYIFGNKSS